MINSLRPWLLAVLSVALLAAPAAAPAQPPPSPAVTLHPGDVLQVSIWREPDLSGAFVVGVNGRVTLPLLGERQVVDVPVDSLQATLLEQYRVYLRNPSITIVPLRRVQVLGEVAKPGLYSVDPTVTVAGAVALAGGATSAGDLGKIRIVRDGRVYSQRVGPQTALAAADIRSGDQIFVERRNWFDRNSTFLVSVLLSVSGIIISIINSN